MTNLILIFTKILESSRHGLQSLRSYNIKAYN